ncbi:hypothetical protein MHTCC0001_20400 [Flavobacteriaceae bacterium MHTCC 0001]
MKCKTTHISFVICLIFTFQTVLASTALQEPEVEVHRVFDADFKERYSGEKYNYEGRDIVGKTKMGSGKYEDYDKQKVKTREQDNSEHIIINIGPFAWVFYAILAAAIIYLVYILLNEGSTGLFSSNKNKVIEHHDDITAENIEHADIHTLIKKAENNGDYRLAIRYYYLLTLKTLSLKNHIKFEDDKTNAEYLNEISDKPFNNGFSYVSYLYNYIWYGKFNVEALQYTQAKENFTTLLNQVT